MFGSKSNIQVVSRIFLLISAVLFVVALFVRLIFASWDEASLFYFIGSLVCLVLSVALDFKAYQALFRLRFTRKSIHASRPLVISAFALIALNYAVTYFPMKVDLSEELLTTLTPFSKRVAKSFNDTVNVNYFYIPDSESREMEINIRTAIQTYQDENTHIHFNKYNVLNHPEMAEKYGLRSQEAGLVMEYKDRSERFYKTDENSITQTLLRLSKGRQTVYFSVGHGERSLSEKAAAGLTSLKKEVERLFYDTQEINLNNEMLPDSAAALVVMAPEKDLTEKAQEKILEYFHKGGRLLIAYDPLSNNGDERLLKSAGVTITKGVVHLDENALAASGSHLVSGVVKDPKNPLLEGLGTDSVVIFYVTGAIEIAKDAPTIVTPLIVSPETSILRAGFTKNDKQLGKGSYNLIVHVKDANMGKGQMFIAADGDLFSNQFIYQHLNPTLMFNLFNSITNNEDVISATPPVTSKSRDFLVTEIQYKMYIGLFILPLPVLLFFMGGFVWLRRRWL